VTRSVCASVDVSKAERKKVDVSQNEAGEVLLQSVLGTNVEQLCPVEGLAVLLLHDEDLVVNLLLPQVVVHVVDEALQLIPSLPVWHDNRCGEAGVALVWDELACN
jgi:hypothetical protein